MIYIHSKNTVTFYEAPESIETAIHNLLMCRDDTDVGMGYDGDLTRPAYEQGLNDAWECVRKIVCDCNYPNNHLRQYVTNGDTLVKFFIDTSASEAIAKVKEYEEKQKKCTNCRFNTRPTHSVCSSCISSDRYEPIDDEIKVGDEVYFSDENHTRVVFSIFYENAKEPRVLQFTESGNYVVDNISDLHKTGRHFLQIEEVLKQMKGE